MAMMESGELVETIEERSDYEIERGKPAPSKKHAIAQTQFVIAFYRNYEEKFRVLTEVTLDLGNYKPTPDICVYPKSEISWEGDEVRLTKMPLLTIEILSPKQALSDLEDKVEDYLAAGVKSCWIVLPSLSEIVVYHKGQKPKIVTEGDVKDDVIGVTVSVEEIFR